VVAPPPPPPDPIEGLSEVEALGVGVNEAEPVGVADVEALHVLKGGGPLQTPEMNSYAPISFFGPHTL